MYVKQKQMLAIAMVTAIYKITWVFKKCRNRIFRLMLVWGV